MVRAAITDPTPARYEVVLKDIAALLQKLTGSKREKMETVPAISNLAGAARQVPTFPRMAVHWLMENTPSAAQVSMDGNM